MDINDKTAWVTGASSGIGRALAIALSAAGAKIILSGRNLDALAATAAACAGPTMTLPFEAADVDAIPAIVAQALAWQGAVDILVNNAGISQRGLAVETVPEVYRKIIEIDLLAPILLTQALLPNLTATPGRMIVTISSIAGRIGAIKRTAYSAAKHGIIGYMDALRAETELVYGLKVLNVLPGSVATSVGVNALTASGSPQAWSDGHIDEGLNADDCAAAIIGAVKEDKREIIIAKEGEGRSVHLRHQDPDRFFDHMATAGLNQTRGH